MVVSGTGSGSGSGGGSCSGSGRVVVVVVVVVAVVVTTFMVLFAEQGFPDSIWTLRGEGGLLTGGRLSMREEYQGQVATCGAVSHPSCSL